MYNGWNILGQDITDDILRKKHNGWHMERRYNGWNIEGGVKCNIDGGIYLRGDIMDGILRDG
jgi:hypothetical protein